MVTTRRNGDRESFDCLPGSANVAEEPRSIVGSTRESAEREGSEREPERSRERFDSVVTF